MTTILPNSIQLEKSLAIRPQLVPIVTSQNLDKSLSIRPPTLIQNHSASSQEPSLVPLNQMMTSEMLASQSISIPNKQDVIAILQNSKTPTSVINEKLQRCSDFRQGKHGPIMTGFKENSPKEELVLEHVIQYKRQFQLVYESENRELFLYPKNECDVYKVFSNIHLIFYPLFSYFI